MTHKLLEELRCKNAVATFYLKKDMFEPLVERDWMMEQTIPLSIDVKNVQPKTCWMRGGGARSAPLPVFVSEIISHSKNDIY